MLATTATRSTMMKVRGGRDFRHLKRGRGGMTGSDDISRFRLNRGGVSLPIFDRTL
jgi:hypothetical protein